EMSLPGYNKEDINIAIMDGKLVISSEVEKSTEDTYRLKEFSYEAFIISLIILVNCGNTT
ncbi:MAG: Hsp20/alpha crystallin family protein, partial [Saprospiraceae bacterium]|nr:Hsp20/alpha crystallin family protein [Saprospiraceae bacterium]